MHIRVIRGVLKIVIGCYRGCKKLKAVRHIMKRFFLEFSMAIIMNVFNRIHCMWRVRPKGLPR